MSQTYFEKHAKKNNYKTEGEILKSYKNLAKVPSSSSLREYEEEILKHCLLFS